MFTRHPSVPGGSRWALVWEGSKKTKEPEEQVLLMVKLQAPTYVHKCFSAFFLHAGALFSPPAPKLTEGRSTLASPKQSYPPLPNHFRLSRFPCSLTIPFFSPISLSSKPQSPFSLFFLFSLKYLKPLYTYCSPHRREVAVPIASPASSFVDERHR